MENKTLHWLEQSDYDADTAKYMFDGGRYFYAVFMCHLAIEKALKGLYFEKTKNIPPKTHNLIWLLNEMNLMPPQEKGQFIVKINSASVVTRYPENLKEIKKQYTKDIVKEFLENTNEVLKWIKTQC